MWCCEELLCSIVLVNGEWWSEVHFDVSSVPVKVRVGCSVG